MEIVEQSKLNSKLFQFWFEIDELIDGFDLNLILNCQNL